jgi:hypothetical protein
VRWGGGGGKPGSQMRGGGGGTLVGALGVASFLSCLIVRSDTADCLYEEEDFS